MKRTIAATAVAFSLVASIAALSGPTAMASTTVIGPVFDSIPSDLPGNVPSAAFEATSTSEFGDYVTFDAAHPGSALQSVDVVMSSWGCEDGTWSGGDCETTAGATFSHPITLTLYANDDGAPGAVLKTVTDTFDIPYRPSADPLCTGNNAGKWYSAADATCYNGFATTITFDLSTLGVTLPDSLIYGISYSTTHYGGSPLGEAAPCYTDDGGCGYDSLNVASASTAPSIGTDDDQDGVFLDSSYTGSYCDGGTGGIDTFRLDTPCWTGFNPLVRFNGEYPATLGPCLVDHDVANKTDTLLSNCTTDHTVVVENGWTLDGDGFTITGVDPTGNHFLGAVVQGAGGDDPTVVRHLTVTVANLSNAVCDEGAARLRGILFDGTGGTIINNDVIDVKQGINSGCQEGNSIEVRNEPFDNTGVKQAVSITGNTVSGYQKGGIVANGSVAATIKNNTVSGAGRVNYIAQNGIQIAFGATAVVKKNTSTGNYYTPKSFVACGLLIYQADGVSASGNSFSNNERNQCNFGKGGGTFNPAP